jgi:hypothetical protein
MELFFSVCWLCWDAWSHVSDITENLLTPVDQLHIRLRLIQNLIHSIPPNLDIRGGLLLFDAYFLTLYII